MSRREGKPVPPIAICISQYAVDVVDKMATIAHIIRFRTPQAEEIAVDIENLASSFERIMSSFLQRYEVEPFELVSLIEIWRERCGEIIEEARKEIFKGGEGRKTQEKSEEEQYTEM